MNREVGFCRIVKSALSAFRRGQKGFTLIELMIVIAIIGILAAITIPQFITCNKAGYNASAKADIKNAYTAAQAYFNQNPSGAISGTADIAAMGYNPTTGVTVTVSGAASALAITASHHSGDVTYSVTSDGVITP